MKEFNKCFRCAFNISIIGDGKEPFPHACQAWMCNKNFNPNDAVFNDKGPSPIKGYHCPYYTSLGSLTKKVVGEDYLPWYERNKETNDEKRN